MLVNPYQYTIYYNIKHMLAYNKYKYETVIRMSR